jgi:tryptophanase
MPSAPLGEFLDRTIRLLGREPLERLRDKRVAIAGCGGVGGAASIGLARLGVEKFTLADPGRFDPPDINRQWGAFHSTLGRNKAEVYDELVKSINPAVTTRTFTEGVTSANVAAFVDGADLLLDSLDIAVPAALRLEMYRLARERGIPSMIAPILGLGTVVAVSVPGGMPLEAFGAVLVDTVSSASLPARLYEMFVPAHLEALGRALKENKAPSNAIASTIATSIVCTEALMILGGPSVPGWRPPYSLPQTIAVDLAKMSFGLVSIAQLLQPRAAASPAATSTSTRAQRERLLALVANNTNLLPPDAATVDLLTDSWSELPARPPAPTLATGLRPEEFLKELYGYEHVVPVFRGRYAEALLAKAIVQPKRAVLSNTLFPTTRFHLESNGASVVDIGVSAGDFLGDLDLARANSALAAGDVQAIYVELANNAIGGHPVSLANLRALHAAARAAGIPLILDATRAYENAVFVRAREPGLAGASLNTIVRALCAASDACASSLTKDFRAPSGAFIGVRDPKLAERLVDCALLGYGDGLDAHARGALAAALGLSHDGAEGASGRVALVERLWQALRALGVPVVGPPGGHAVFVDAAALLPEVAAAAHPAATLCAALFACGGVRASVHLGANAWIRLAVPIGLHDDAMIEIVRAAFAAVVADKARWKGLKRTGGPSGMIGEFAAQYAPL